MPVPSTFGKYHIEREVGRGGFAVVYQAFDPTLGRRVAIKVPHPWLLADPKFVERFRREARLAANLTHPHIVTIYEIGEEQGTPFIAMEWLEGMPFQDWLRQMQPTPQAALQALAGVGAALDYAHARQVIHRDIKPSNIMMAAGRGGVLTDFGIARLLAQTTQSTSSVMGTPNYMAPEVLKGQPATAATDIYALGVMLFEILTGRLPFYGDTPHAVAFQHASEPPPDPRSLNPALPKPTADLLLQALAKDPRQRPVGAERLIRNVLTGLIGDARAFTPKAPASPPSRRNLFALVGVLLVLFVVALFAWALTRDGAPPTPPPIEVTQDVSDNVASVSSPAPTPTATSSPIPSTTPAPPLSPTPTATSSPIPSTTPAPPLSPTPTPTPIPIPIRIVTLPGNGFGHIVFNSSRDGNPELYMMNANGKSLRRLTNSPGDDWSPTWSRDGQQIAFTSSRDATTTGMHNIYIMNADGSNVRRLTSNQAWDEYADWSPDGSQILFVTTADDNAEIFIMPVYGGDARRLTWTSFNEQNPTWSPDGNQIAFSANPSGSNEQIYLMSADSDNRRQISFMNGNSYKPAWSPDGRWLAFHSDHNGNRDIYVMSPDGSDLRRLTTDPSRDEHPSWSPDGSAIVFSSDRGGGTANIYIMRADGSEQTRLFASPAADGSPAWGP